MKLLRLEKSLRKVLELNRKEEINMTKQNKSNIIDKHNIGKEGLD